MFGTRFRFLLDKASDPGDGGSGGGEPKLTDDMKKEIAALVGPMISGAFKNEGARLIAKSVADGLKTALSKEALAPLFTEFVRDLPDDDDDDGDGRADPPKPNKPDPQIAALTAKVTELTNKIAEDAAKLEKAQAEARDKDALSALKSALAPHVKPEALDMAASLLFTAQRRVTFDDGGNPLFTIRKAPYTGANEEDVAMPLNDGVQHWLKSAEGKFFVPAPSGEQQRNGGAPRRVTTGANGLPSYDKPATTEGEKLRRVDERVNALLASRPELKG